MYRKMSTINLKKGSTGKMPVGPTAKMAVLLCGKVRDREDAIANTRDACATRKEMHRAPVYAYSVVA
jgi:hypothetical protein